MSNFNKTQLYIDKAAEREIVHRDYLAHTLRWTHILRHAKIGMKILDVGCGVNTPLAMMFYTNRYKPDLYVGLDIRKDFQEHAFNFEHELIGGFDATNEAYWEQIPHVWAWDIVTCLEVIEHMEQEDGLRLLENLAAYCSPRSLVFLSTPCFNGSKAANHIYEWTYSELRENLETDFTIEAVHGTFASQRDILPVLSSEERRVFDMLRTYYDSNLLSIMLAPLHPEHSRNCIWRLRAK
jgi:SAM-dependent methyltransferase